MAGIGFELRALERGPAISTQLSGSLHAVWICAGPVVVAAASILGIGILARSSIVAAELQLFKISLVYAFLASLIGASPAAMIGARLAADAIYARASAKLPGHFLGALVAGTLMSAACGLAVFVGSAALPAWTLLAALALTISTGWLWTAIAFIGALRDYRAIGLSFVSGVGAILGLALLALPPEMPAGALLMLVAIGGLVTTTQLAIRITTFHASAPPPWRTAVAEMTSGASRLWELGAGAVLAAAGAWVDKWVIWGSELGTAGAGGLRHAPLYDYATFLAFLAMLPLLAELLIRRETELYTLLRRLIHVLLEHGTLAEIESSAADLASAFRRTMQALLLRQLLIALLLILALPALAEWLPIAYRQLPTVRYALLGGVMHIGLIAASSALLLTDSRGSYLVVQALFLGLNGGLTLVLLPGGLEVAGLGYLLAALTSALVAYALAHRTLHHLPYLLFRRSLRASAAA